MLPQKLFTGNWLIVGMLLGILMVLAACGGAEPQVVEVTRIVTETEEVEVEGEVVEVEVTRIVESETETVVEEVVVEEEEMAEEPAAEEAPDDTQAVGSEDDDGSPFEPDEGPKVSTTREAGGGWVDESVSNDDTVRGESQPVAQVEMTMTPTVTPAAPTDSSAAADNQVAVRAEEEGVAELNAASQLTAGELDDNAAWEAYLAYLADYQSAGVIPVNVSGRQVIEIVDAQNRPLLGAAVTIAPVENDAAAVTLHTTSSGRVYFFPRAYAQMAESVVFNVTVQYGETTTAWVLNTTMETAEWEIQLAVEESGTEQTAVDILFLLDATGSMGDEIQQLKENIEFIAQVVSELPSQPDVRFGMTVYRDRGEAFTSRTFDFTAEVDTFAAALAEVEAQGGGDYPEDLNEGLFKALSVPAWREGEVIKLVFLVADAPPHVDYEAQTSDYAEQMRAAAAQGIKIYPIGSSGLDHDGEYVFRQLAQFTGGKFLFLTYGAAGAGSTGEETDLAVGEGEYDVTSLDGLIIKIIEEELAYRESPPS